MRAISVAFSPARPSRLKNEPGILPAAYIRSSMSTVSGMKSMSRRFPAVAVPSTRVSPAATRTEPEACLAILPVSKWISVPPISTETRCTSAMCSFLDPPLGPWRVRSSQNRFESERFQDSGVGSRGCLHGSSSSAPRDTRGASPPSGWSPHGARPVLAGRSAERLRALAGTARRARDARSPTSTGPRRCAALVARGDVLVTHGRAVHALGRAGGARGDRRAARSTSTRRASRRSSAACSGVGTRPRGASGATLLTAMGYDFVPGALAGALALREAGEGAVRVDVGYYALGGGPAVAVARHARLARRHRPRPLLRLPRRRGPHRALGRADALLRRARASDAAGDLRRRRGALHAPAGVPARCARSTSTWAGSARSRAGSTATSRATALAGKVPGLTQALVARRGQARGDGRRARGGHDAGRALLDRRGGVRRRRRAARRGPPLRRGRLRVHGGHARLGRRAGSPTAARTSPARPARSRRSGSSALERGAPRPASPAPAQDDARARAAPALRSRVQARSLREDREGPRSVWVGDRGRRLRAVQVTLRARARRTGRAALQRTGTSAGPGASGGGRARSPGRSARGRARSPAVLRYHVLRREQRLPGTPDAGVPLLRRRPQPRGDHAAVPRLPRRHAAADRRCASGR